MRCIVSAGNVFRQRKNGSLEIKMLIRNSIQYELHHYVHLILEEVLQYVGDMKKRSASKIKLAVQKQHNKTMQKTRQYYINYLQQVLKIDNLR